MRRQRPHPASARHIWRPDACRARGRLRSHSRCPPALPETELSAFLYSRPSVPAAFEARRSVLRHENVRSQALPRRSSFVPPCPRSVPTERTQQKGSTNDRTLPPHHLRDSQFLDRKRVVEGKSWSVRVVLGCRPIIKK